MAKRNGGKSHSRESSSDKAGASEQDDRGKLKRRDYEKALERLHAELVKLQEWVRHQYEAMNQEPLGY